MEWVIKPYRRYAQLNGRSLRREYWSFLLFYFFVPFMLYVLTRPWANISSSSYDIFSLVQNFSLLFMSASLIPLFAVSVRRLHDQDRSGWFLLIGFFPIIGHMIVFCLMLIDGTAGQNRFSPDPKAPEEAGIFS